MEGNMQQFLSLMTHPAFCVEDGIITAANEGALNRLIPTGSPILPLLETGREEYQNFTQGRLCLSLAVSGTIWDATVQAVDGVHLFTLDPEQSEAQLQTLALAAQQLRSPLSSIKAMMDQLIPKLSREETDTTGQQLAYLYRAMDQMQRIVYNMSDTGAYVSTPPRFSVRDMDALLEELVERCGDLCGSLGIRLTYAGTGRGIYTMVDANRLERCFYNILSNALKHTPQGGSIAVQLQRRGNLLLLTVADSGDGIDPEQTGDLYNRYLRSPAIEQQPSGLGLGLPLIRAFARAHGGTVLLTSEKGKGTKITLSLKIQLEPTLSSPIVPYDYAGEQDHALIELSDALPPELYRPEKY